MKKVSLYVGDSTGLKILKQYIKNKFLISYVVPTDKKYANLIKNICKQNSIKYFSKKEIGTFPFKRYNKQTNIIFSLFSRYIFSEKFIKNFSGHIFNIHPGLLPFYPGTNSISGTLYNCEKYTGVTIHLVNKKIDGGKIILNRKFKIKKNELAIDVWKKIQVISLKMADILYYKVCNNKLEFKNNNTNKKKNFPKFIPNNGIIKPNFSNLKEVLILYRASYYFPFKSPWGNLKILYKKKLLTVINIKIIFNNNFKFDQIKKIKNKTYLVKLVNKKVIRVKTN